MSENTKHIATPTIIAIIFLIFFFPVGLLLMWRKTQWPQPVKWMVSAFFSLILLGNINAFSHVSVPAENQVIVTKASPSATPTPTHAPTPTRSYTPTPIPTKYILPTAIPTAQFPTATPTAPVVTSQQSVQNNNGATALCNDGTYSYAQNDQGACSHHQGVKVFYK
jgi:glucan phosphoethanolaminetransferase (alkaline phosphatase superfamily)